MKPTRVGIIGIGQSEFKPRRDDANYTELVREGVTLALRDESFPIGAILPFVQVMVLAGSTSN